MLETLFFQEWSQNLSIDGIPPAVRALNDHIEIVRIYVHIMLFPVFADRKTDFLLHIRGNGVFRGVHVCNFGMNQSLREFLPCRVRNIVVLTDVQTPNIARRLLKDAKKMVNLIVSHSFVEIL